LVSPEKEGAGPRFEGYGDYFCTDVATYKKKAEQAQQRACGTAEETRGKHPIPLEANKRLQRIVAKHGIGALLAVLVRGER